MRIVIAPAAYRGSLLPPAVAEAMARGVLKVFPDAEICKVPLTDGGEGFVESLVTATHGELKTAEVTSMLGEPVSCSWGVLGDGRTAVVALSSLVGSATHPVTKRESSAATTLGLGELLRLALDAGHRRILIGLSGAPLARDGGTGMMRALGARFLDARRRELPLGGRALSRLASIDMSGFDRRLHDSEIIVATDAWAPLQPPRRVSDGRGRRSDPDERWDTALWHYAEIAECTTGHRVANVEGAGAAGGLGIALLSFTPSAYRSGIELILHEARLAERVKEASFVLTGEGRTDFQTAFGKAPVAVARIARRFQVPVYCLSGSVGDGADETLLQGIDAVLSICDRPMTLSECMQNGAGLVELATTRLCRVVCAAGTSIG